MIRGGHTILSVNRLAVNPGEHWAVLGPNGAGKSTLLKTLGTHHYPSRGTVTVLGETRGRTDVFALRKRIGYVDPKQHLGDIDCYEAVLSGVTASRGFIPRWEPTPQQVARAREVIALVGMGERSDRRWMHMSQGEKARTLIARALVTNPRLLLLDEPSIGLDLPGRWMAMTHAAP